MEPAEWLGYHIYCGDYVVRDVLSASSTSFVNLQLDGDNIYSYLVQAFASSGSQSGFTASASATTSAMLSAPIDYARCGAAAGSAGRSYTTTVAADLLYPDSGGRSLTDIGALRLSLRLAAAGRHRRKQSRAYGHPRRQRSIWEINTTWLQVRTDYVFLAEDVTYSSPRAGSPSPG